MAKIFGKDPYCEQWEKLSKLKWLMENGEAASSYTKGFLNDQIIWSAFMFTTARPPGASSVCYERD